MDTNRVADKCFLITGGAGFIGSHIVDYLLSHHAKKVRVLDNLSNGSIHNIKQFFANPAFEFIQEDTRDLDSCRRACNGIDFVSHQAAVGSVPRSIKDPVTTNDVNINGHLNILVACRELGVQNIVYASSSSVYGDSISLPKKEAEIGKPLSPYAVTKFVNELYADVFAKQYGMNITGLRYFNVFEPKQDPNGMYAAVIPLFIKSALHNEAPKIYGDGLQTRDFTYVQNVVKANLLALLKEREDNQAEIYNVAVGERISLLDLWEMIASISGCTIKPVHLPERAGDIKDSLASLSKAEELLRYSPDIKIREGLAFTYQYYLHTGSFRKKE